MQRTVIVAPRGEQKTVIETLHQLRAAHLVDFTENREGAMADFRIGRPLAEAGAASEKLVRIRALLRHLSLEGTDASKPTPFRALETGLEERLAAIERDANAAAEEKTRAHARAETLADEATRLAPLAALPLKLEDYSGYESLKVFVGFGDDELKSGLLAVVPDALVFTGEDGLVAAFVPAARAAAASDVVYQHGFREHPVPAGTGDVASRQATVETERAAAAEEATRAEARLAEIAAREGDFLIAAEEHLSIAVQKAEAPLSFATTENAFVVDAWLPQSRFNEVRNALHKATNGAVHVERIAHVARGMHGMDDVHGGHDAHDHAEHDEKDNPPTMLANPGPAKNFHFFTEMFSVPKYDEIDPTVVLSIAFPLFFGFMIGDLGLGVVMALLGFTFMRKLKHVEGMRELGFAILVAGVIAAIFGGLVFKDAFGIPLGSTHEIEEHVAHALHGSGGAAAADGSLQGADGHGPSSAAVNDTAGAVAAHASATAATCAEIYKHAHEATWSCLLSGGASTGLGDWSEPIIYKISDVRTMLLISIGAAFVHLFLGLMFGIRNEWGHGWKHLTAKFGWLLLLVTFFPAVVSLLDAEWLLATTGMTANLAYMIAGGGFLAGAVILGVTEGVVGVLEIPSMLSNILSYLRLGAVAIAKGAMAVAFNNLTLVSIALGGGGWLMIILGLVAFVLVQALLFVLGMLSAGIQAIRLNYVEFFTKFYKGGGEKFSPFGRARRFSAGSVTGGGKL